MVETTTTVRFDPATNEKLKELARTTHRPESFYIRQMVDENIDRMLYEYGILQDREDLRAGRLETISLDEMRKLSAVAD